MLVLCVTEKLLVVVVGSVECSRLGVESSATRMVHIAVKIATFSGVKEEFEIRMYSRLFW